ncbi:PA2169 family four-helix-bundle protein [Mucilaginibacter terrenus]|uniref:PA2169 family four-helix-bundle protein n=1 Tax=Mucilaginibacter terrenus TaxID=2482727 RepID=A0A3E2NTM1_9SPHI|nr:PA2169 family four-helix-bundle protein [Mucilaginibacter terrenus]RFZ84354.1 PA2169 family four-helix-bundle protein [Mucilaginibacter terrenus]
MENAKATVEALNDLIAINNDRVAGFERAISEIKDDKADLKYLFTNCIGVSHQFKMELATEVAALGKDIETDSSKSGKLHRTWLDLKATFTGHSTHSVLEECEFGEDAIKKSYQTALDDEALPAYVKDILKKQQVILNAAHDKIKALRDSVAN